MQLILKIRLTDGRIIKRVPKFIRYGNFVYIIVRYKNFDYLVGDGDEYLRGIDNDKVFELGKRLGGGVDE